MGRLQMSHKPWEVMPNNGPGGDSVPKLILTQYTDTYMGQVIRLSSTNDGVIAALLTNRSPTNIEPLICRMTISVSLFGKSWQGFKHPSDAYHIM